jgi:hypothetical protein
MDSQRFESLQKRVETLERRLRLALVALLLIAVSVVTGVVVQRAHSQQAAKAPEIATMPAGTADVVFKYYDSQAHVNCYVILNPQSPRLVCLH